MGEIGIDVKASLSGGGQVPQHLKDQAAYEVRVFFKKVKKCIGSRLDDYRSCYAGLYGPGAGRGAEETNKAYAELVESCDRLAKQLAAVEEAYRPIPAEELH